LVELLLAVLTGSVGLLGDAIHIASDVSAGLSRGLPVTTVGSLIGDHRT
jgi:Co/Zn/Cd efflux system component